MLGVKGRVCGLCGNFDGNVNNDLMSSNNQLEVDSSHFGNSWKVAPSCADVAQVKSDLGLKSWFAEMIFHLNSRFLAYLYPIRAHHISIYVSFCCQHLSYDILYVLMPVCQNCL